MDITQETTSLNTSVVELSKDELLKEYSNLKVQYLSQKESLEEKTQELFDCKRQLNVSKAIENDLNQEIEHLQTNEKLGSEKLLNKIVNLEEELKIVKEQFRNQINQLEKENVVKGEEIDDLKTVIESGGNIGNSSLLKSEELDKVKNENVLLKEEILSLIDASAYQKDALNKYIDDNCTLQETITFLKNDIEEIKQSLNFKKDELNNVHSILHTCQEENILLKTELDSLKNNPLDHEKKGNSLFAEVNDRRIQLQKTNELLKQRYADMKKQLTLKMKELTTIKNENSKLSRRWEDDLQEKEEIEYDWKKSFEAQINDLNKLIENYQIEASKKIALENVQLTENSQLQFVEHMVQSKMDQITKLNTELRAMSFNKWQLSDSLRDVKRELQKWRATAAHRKTEVELLKANIEEMKSNMTLSLNETEIGTKNPLSEKNIQESDTTDININKEFCNLNRISILKPNQGILKMPHSVGDSYDQENQPQENGTEATDDTFSTDKKRVGFATGTKETVTTIRPRKSHKPACKTVVVRNVDS